MLSVAIRLRSTQKRLEVLHPLLHLTLEHAKHLGLHSTYTAALKRIIQHNNTTITSIANLARTLERKAQLPQP